MSHHDADEAIQETAARAVSAALAFHDEDDLFRWCAVVSWRIAIDARRRCTRVTSHEVPDRADHVDVAQVAENRIVLSAVTARFQELSERDRSVLLANFDEQSASSRLEQVRLAVARHRARSRLRTLLDGLAAPVLAFAARRWRMRSAQAEPFALTAAPAVVFLALSVGVLAPAGSVGRPSEPVANAMPARSAVAEVPAAMQPNLPAVPTSAPKASGTPTPTIAPSASAVQVHLEPGVSPYPTNAGIRDNQPSDHTACVTLPSLAGPATTCVDPPALISP